jgi:hypothetical protein
MSNKCLWHRETGNSELLSLLGNAWGMQECYAAHNLVTFDVRIMKTSTFLRILIQSKLELRIH